MERADLYRVFELGAALKPARELRDGAVLSEVFSAIISAQSALRTLLSADPQVRTEFSLAAAKEALDAIEIIDRLHFRDANSGSIIYPEGADSKIIEPWHLWRLTKAMQNFDSVFRAEMKVAATYWVPKRGTYNTNDMVDAFDRSFLPELIEFIGEKSLSEYRNAGRCFAFGLWSAAGYHACRAVEAVLRPYYCLLTSKEDREAKTWGDLIKELKAKADEPMASDKAIFYLQQLKDNERNPLMHVRVVLDEQDADILLNSAKIVIVLMAREIKTIQCSRDEAHEIDF
jgi:hypothetical protein